MYGFVTHDDTSFKSMCLEEILQSNYLWFVLDTCCRSLSPCVQEYTFLMITAQIQAAYGASSRKVKVLPQCLATDTPQQSAVFSKQFCTHWWVAEVQTAHWTRLVLLLRHNLPFLSFHLLSQCCHCWTNISTSRQKTFQLYLHCSTHLETNVNLNKLIYSNTCWLINRSVNQSLSYFCFKHILFT